jgi:hypothetical protein
MAASPTEAVVGQVAELEVLRPGEECECRRRCLRVMRYTRWRVSAASCSSSAKTVGWSTRGERVKPVVTVATTPAGPTPADDETVPGWKATNGWVRTNWRSARSPPMSPTRESCYQLHSVVMAAAECNHGRDCLVLGQEPVGEDEPISSDAKLDRWSPCKLWIQSASGPQSRADHHLVGDRILAEHHRHRFVTPSGSAVHMDEHEEGAAEPPSPNHPGRGSAGSGTPTARAAQVCRRRGQEVVASAR